MRIAIDASRCTPAQRTGTEHYSLALLRALIEHNHEYFLTLYFRERPAADLLPQISSSGGTRLAQPPALDPLAFRGRALPANGRR